ncbi:acyl-CoA dehydrogenase family protein [Paracraurococcus ruber]|uniref:DNA alkylation response protein n=1 Tax=Paracraurococcus ruber TaxID=77675 RepID=A0ABS1CQT2_9PROT|nr:acyl-CoA dehydrogenase family protein [Paracraurococcus ruber]MBK1656802.1 DNA alkylation response protein [Paracraurococcus ruber]TDG29786.1 DNA alkylation response protein [Paracraurococcus ruber]
MDLGPIAQPPAPPAGADAVPDSHGLNLWRADPWLAPLLGLYLPADLLAHLAPHLDRMGALAGGRLDTLAGTADRAPPVLRHRTRRGDDVQAVEYHPAYCEMERIAFAEYGLAAMSHRGGVLGWPAPMPPAAKYALTYLFVQAEFGLCCPLSMTDALARTLRRFGGPDLVARYLPALTATDLDALRQGAMFMTEQGAGSDIAATAVLAGEAPDGTWRLTGDKWFCSNPDAGMALVLARRQGGPAGLRGVSLFLLPRDLPDGTRNAYRIVRLKDKLGSRGMASGEVRLEGATAFLVGAPEAGFRQMADMVNASRLSNGMRAAGLMRRAVTEAMHVARHRIAFGRRLVDMPLMRRQLLKLALPMEQARSMVFQAAEALRRSDAGEDGAHALLRILTPLLKFRACRDARKVTGDAMEVRGGCGYIEEWPDPRLLRDAHLGSIWEGTSNIVALDVLRAAQRERSLPVLRAHVAGLLGNAGALPGALPLFDRAAALAERAQENPALARQAASALYHLTSAAAMAWEAQRLDDPARLALAKLVLTHRVLPKDPLADDDKAVPDDLLDRLLAQ